MIISSAVITGFSNQIKEKIVAFWGDIHITNSNISRNFEQIPIEDAYELMAEIDSIKYLEYEDTRKVLGIPIESSRKFYRSEGGVSSVQGTAMLPGLMRTRKFIHGILLKGVGKDFDWNRMKKYMVSGEIMTFSDSTSSRDILLSRSTAKKLELQVGDRLNMSFIRDKKHLKRGFTVKGIYNTGLEEYDSKIAIVDIEKIRELLGWDSTSVGNVEVVIEQRDDLDLLTEYIYLDVIPPDLYAETIQDKFPNIFEWLKLQEVNEKVILALMVVVGIINMLTVLLILILERSKMIGVLKALGAQSWSIRKIFLYNSGYIIFWGMAIGNLVGLLFCFLQWKYGFVSLDEENYYLSVAPIEVELWHVLLINLGTFVITLLVMIIPTWLISFISPIKVLRFE